jgi:LysM repeat protein
MHYFSLDRQYKFILNLMESKKQAPSKRKLGYVSEKYESNAKIGSISTGKGDRGGVSYGTTQFASNKGTPALFVEHINQNEPQDSPLRSLIGLNDFRDYTGKFANEWRKLSASHPELLSKVAQEFTDIQYYEKPLEILRKKDPELANLIKTNEGLSELFYSASVQHGQTGVRTIFQNAKSRCPDGKKNCPFAITENVFQERIKRMQNSKGNDQTVKDNVINKRYPEEKETIKGLLNPSRTLPTLEAPDADEKQIQDANKKPRTVTIKSGDTLSQIAKANGLTVQQLLDANKDIKDPNKIRAGQKLNLPSK